MDEPKTSRFATRASPAAGGPGEVPRSGGTRGIQFGLGLGAVAPEASCARRERFKGRLRNLLFAIKAFCARPAALIPQPN